MSKHTEILLKFLDYIGNLDADNMVNYFSYITLTLEVNKLESKLLKDEEIQPLFYKQIDQFGIIKQIAENPNYPGNADLPENIELTIEQVESVTDLILSEDPVIMNKLDVMVCVGGIEYRFMNAQDQGPWLRRRYIVREYDEYGFPISYKFHESIKITKEPKRIIL